MVTLDAPALLRALEAGEARLASHVDHVNKLNVYPVPDGDTGTNMLHTVRSAVSAARRADDGAGGLMAAAAHGALMGARGNSGVILSQFVAGAKAAFAGKDVIGTRELVEAFSKARDLAYQAVAQPVEGTILTAIGAMAEAIRTSPAGDVVTMFDHAVEAGRAAVAMTPDLLPVLKHAGVVDAGAQGLVYIVEGMADMVAGRVSTVERAEAEGTEPETPFELGGVDGGEWGYDVQFLVPAPKRSVAEVREEMNRYGLEHETLGCVLVVGDESLLKVHVHTQSPHEILRIGLSAGGLRDIVVENLDAMAAERERATGVTVSQRDMEIRPLAVVAVVSGPGLAAVCRSLGARPLSGGRTTNPSVEEIVRAIADAPGESVIVLPNDKDILPAAQAAAREAKKPVRVLPTRSMAQGMAALVAFDAHGELAAIASAMESTARAARSVEVTLAARDALVDDVQVRSGQHMALVDGRCVGTAATAEEALRLAGSAIGRAELCTLYVGAGVGRDRADRAEAALRSTVGCQVEVVDGGQPHYPYIVSTE
jgi:DAK2 domain fusion protein YloV